MSFIFLIIGFVFLIKGADLFVEGAASIAKKFNVPAMVIGLTVIVVSAIWFVFIQKRYMR